MPKLSNLYTTKEINAIRQDLIERHGNNCAICKKPRSAFKKNLSVDHNHRSNKIRGLLCFRCNKLILGRHTIESARSILAYLLKYDDVPND
jgi:Recombination endonuclease VII